jgi:hypothetical protein
MDQESLRQALFEGREHAAKLQDLRAHPKGQARSTPRPRPGRWQRSHSWNALCVHQGDRVVVAAEPDDYRVDIDDEIIGNCRSGSQLRCAASRWPDGHC